MLGKVWLQLHDKTIRDVTDIQYILNIKKILISLEVLDGRGLQATLADSSLIATKSVLVVMKDILKKNLFYQQGSIVADRVIMASHMLGIDVDTSRLLHMRLEYAGKAFL